METERHLEFHHPNVPPTEDPPALSTLPTAFGKELFPAFRAGEGEGHPTDDMAFSVASEVPRCVELRSPFLRVC
jgi:hypothetical protein